MNFFSRYGKVVIAMGLFLAFAPSLAYAENEHHHNKIADTLGWTAIGAGTVANLSFVVFNAIKKAPRLKVGVANDFPKAMFAMYKPMLNFHILLNSVVFFAGMMHGLILLRGLDSISLSLAIVMCVSMTSGIILRLGSDKHWKHFGRLVHGQVVMSILLVSLVVLHVALKSG